MTEETDIRALTDEDIEEESATELPDREEMSLINPALGADGGMAYYVPPDPGPAN